MKTFAFRLKLKPGCAAEYARRHNHVWPELLALLKQAGISDYSIFLDAETNSLFGVLKAVDPQALADLPSAPLMRRWYDHMADILETQPDNSPQVTALQQVFHLG